MRTLLWSTPVTWGTNHRGLVSTGTCSDLLPFGVEKATRFSKCNPLHILYIIAQVETFGCHLLFATMFAFYTVRLSLLEPNFCLAGPMGDMALPNLNLPTILEEVWPNKLSRRVPWVTSPLTICFEVSLCSVLQKQHYLGDRIPICYLLLPNYPPT